MLKRERKLVALAVLATTVATTAISFVQNYQASAESNIPSWGNDGLGVVFKDNFTEDDNGVVSKQFGTAVIGDWVEYSIKLDAKQYVNNNIATNYMIALNTSELEKLAVTETFSEEITVGGVEYEHEQRQLSGSGLYEGWRMYSVPWADVEHDGVCRLIMYNERPDSSDSEILFNAREDCLAIDGLTVWEENETITEVTPLLGDDEIEIKIRFKLSLGFDLNTTTISEARLPVKFLYSYYDEQAGKEQIVADEATAQMINNVEPGALQEIKLMDDTGEEAILSNGNLLIRKTDENGTPLAGAKFTIEGIRANNLGGTMFADTYGMYDTFETNERGEILIRGVKFGDYVIKEVEAPDGYEKLQAPQRHSVNRRTTKAQGYYRHKLSSYLLEQLAAQQGTDNVGDIGTLFQVLPNGDLFASQVQGDSLVLRWNEATNRYDISVEGYNTNWYAEKIDDGGIDIVLPNLSANVRLTPGENDGVYYYTPQGSSVPLAYQVSDDDGALSITPVISESASANEESMISPLKRNDHYVVSGSNQEYELSWDEESGIYIYAPRMTDSKPDGLGIIIYEEPDGTLSIERDGNRFNVSDLYSYNEENQRWEGEENGTNVYVWKEDNFYHYVYTDESGVEQMGYVFTYSDSIGGYIADPVISAIWLREIDDETVFVDQGLYFEKVGQERWFGLLLFFPLIVDGTYEESTIIASEVTIVNGRSDSPKGVSLPEDIANPQTSDTSIRILATIIFGFAPMAIARQHLRKR